MDGGFLEMVGKKYKNKLNWIVIQHVKINPQSSERDNAIYGLTRFPSLGQKAANWLAFYQSSCSFESIADIWIRTRNTKVNYKVIQF